MTLDEGPLHRFGDWPVEAVPDAAAGVYTVFRGDEFIYVGMAGRGWSAADLAERKARERRTGLWERLNSHASGRRSGDQFCVYVCDRFIVPYLTGNEQAALAAGDLSLDASTRAFIREELSFRFLEVPDGRSALDLERQVQAGSLDIGKPLLNPI